MEQKEKEAKTLAAKLLEEKVKEEKERQKQRYVFHTHSCGLEVILLLLKKKQKKQDKTKKNCESGGESGQNFSIVRGNRPGRGQIYAVSVLNPFLSRLGENST